MKGNLEICDECLKECEKVYHLEPPKTDKTATRDWYVCEECHQDELDNLVK